MKKLLLFISFFFGCISAYSQSGNLKFDHFGVKEGLPETDVRFVKQDSRGYIWMGTQNGLLRYDGYKPEVYRFGVGKDAISLFCSVESMIEDTNKDLWFSTVNNGIFKYNPSTNGFIQYKYPIVPGKKNFLQQYFAVADKENNLWLYSNYSDDNYTELVKFNPQNGKFERFNTKQTGGTHLNVHNVNCIIKTADKSIWIGTSNGLYKYDYKNKRFDGYLTTTDTSHQQNVNLIYEAPSAPGILWLNIIKKLPVAVLVTFDTHDKSVKVFHPDHFPPLNAFNNIVNTIYEDKRHTLWFTTAHALMAFDNKTETFKYYGPADTGKHVYGNHFFGLAPSKSGSFWIISDEGLLNFDPSIKKFARYMPNSNDSTAVSGKSMNFGYDLTDHLLVDRSDILWAAYNHRGADKVNPLMSAFRIFYKTTAPNSYPGGTAYQIINTGDGYVWFNTRNGIYKWLPGSREFNLVYKATKEDGVVRRFLTGPNGLIYFINNKGLNIYNVKLKTLRSYPSVPNDPTSISSIDVTQMIWDHTGTIWIGTDGNGICSFNPVTNKVTRYQFINNNGLIDIDGKLNDSSVGCLYEDKRGTIWVGTNMGGLSCFDRNTGMFKSYLFDGHIRLSPIVSITEDRNHHLWVGSYFYGLYEFDRKSGHYTRHISEENGLLFNNVTSICEDKSGFLWAICERGLSRINPKDISVKTFPFNTILPGQRLGLYTSLLPVNNQIVFGLESGITLFDPDDLAASPYPPIVSIEKASYSNPNSANSPNIVRKTAGMNSLDLAWNQNKITFNYVAAHFVNPSQNKYAYYLEGYDKQWLQAGTQRSATYTNLAPAKYTFHVKACNSDGVWNNKGDSFTIIINSPLWFRWWAWAIYVVLFVTAVYAFIAYRWRSLIKEKHVLEEKVTVRTKELSEANEELNEKKEEITTQRDQLADAITNLKATQKQLIQSEKMASLGELTAGIAHEIQNPLNFVNNFSELSRELMEEMREEIDKGDIDEIKLIASDIEQNLEKINHHGNRAGAIVKGMLEHSRISKGRPEPADINALAEEYLRLAYHATLAKDKSFAAFLNTDFDKSIGKITIIPQDIGRVLQNLFNNAFYAVTEKAKTAGAGYHPALTLKTERQAGAVIIRVSDNGNGIPKNIVDKIYQPFFTTKPTGQGSTGLGLSLSYDIINAHGGEIKVESTEGEGAEFIISLPSN